MRNGGLDEATIAELKTVASSMLERLKVDDTESPEVWRIELDGKVLVLSSGKHRWSKIGHAKAAFRHQFDYARVGRSQERWLKTGMPSDLVTEFIDDLVKSGRLEYVRVRT